MNTFLENENFKSKKDKSHMISFICRIYNKKNLRFTNRENRLMAGCQRGGEQRVKWMKGIRKYKLPGAPEWLSH